MKLRRIRQEQVEHIRQSWLTMAMAGATAAIRLPARSGRKWIKAVTLASRRWLLILMVAVGQLSLVVASVKADPYPPYWQGGSGPAVHFQPEPWPDEPADPTQCGMNCGDWIPYTRYAFSINDARTQDPSNGGTSPQNYVNIASSCIDESYPSIYYYLDLDNEVLMFRWRVEQIANTYATGPSAGSYSSSDPWSSALWTVFFDLDGDGYRDLAAHLDGSSGSPATPVDRLVGIWADVPNSQSLDYIDDPNIYDLAHNPTGFVYSPTNKILNFHSTVASPDDNWPNGAAETTWNYGPSRSKVITLHGVDGAICDEYFVDYQIPLGLVDASAFSGPKIDRTTPFSMLFCTANSLNDPFQKDCAYQGDWIGDPSEEGPFGDFVSFDDGTIDQPIVTWVDASGCGPTELAVKILDTIDLESGDAETSVQEVDFHYYYDVNGDGEDNDGNSWMHAVDATNVAINRWTASWNSAGLLQGQYLVGVQAVDDGSKNDDGYANRVFSYLSQAEVDALGNDPATSGEEWYPNPDVTGVVATALFANACGAPVPFVSKMVEPSQVTTGETVTFTIAISNTHTDPLTVTVITDTLPPGFVYGDTVGGTLSPTTSPSVGATGNITWTFFPAVAVAPSNTDTLVFTATAPSTVGTYANVVSVKTETSFGTLTSEPVQVGVGAPRLSIAKSASTLSASPGDTITYTITYGNDSTVNVTDAVITDVLPVGVDLVSVLDGGSESGGTITWNVGDIASGEGPFTARFVVTVTNPYPDAAAVPLINTATIDGNETDPANASSATFVDTPRPAFAIQKDGGKIVLDPGDQVTFTLDYANTGNYTATNAIITDTVPDGFTVVRAGSGVTGTGIVTWSIGDVAAGATGFVTLTLEAGNPFTWTNPTTNTVTLDSTQTGLISDTYRIGVNTGAGAGQNCYIPYTGSDTSDSTFDVTLVQTNDDSRDDYVSPAGGYNEATYQEFVFTDTIAGPVDAISAVTVTYAYLEKNLAAAKLEAYVGGSEVCTRALNPTSDNNAEIIEIADFYAGCVDTPAEVNNLRLRALSYYSGDNDHETDFIELCVTITKPPILVVDKQVSNLVAEPGGALTYTIEFGNAGGTDAAGTVITDTLPTGTSFVTATLNGSPITPGNPSPSIYTFTVNSSTGAPGVIKAGESGTLVIEVSVNAPLADGIDSLLNTVELDSDDTTSTTDTILTAVLRPDLSLSKAANDTLLIPGDTVTFTLTVLNSGYATATNVTISDTLPATTYFAYVVGSARLNGKTPGSDPVSGDLMSLDVGELGPGDSAQVTFQMYAHTSGVPDGATELGNTAAVTSTQTEEVSSEAVIVSVSANPNLRLVKSLEPGGTLSPGDLITFTLVVSNAGASDAVDVQVRDPIPDDTAYAAGTLVYSGTAQTDVDDADEGRFDAAGNRIVFEVGTLPAGEGRTMQFTVLVDEPLPNGTTYFTNTATTSAGNAAAKSSTATAQATAAPNLTVSKTGADTLAYPAATLAADVTNATAFQVDDGSQLEVDQYVRVNGYDARITAISGSIITVTAPVTATSGTTVTGGIIYSIGYVNGGTAIANNVVITDTLPPQSAFITATTPHIQSGNTITWTVGSLDPDESGSVQVTVFLTGMGSFTNTAYTDSDETTSISDTVTTSVGGLRVRKRTTTPIVTQTLTGTSATYVIEVENTSASDASGVIVTDTLAAGFTFSETLDIAGGTRDPSTPDPSAGDAQPAWGTFTVTGSSTLYITFTVSISDTVGPATYQNQVLVTSSDTSVTPFDPLLVPDEDVEVQVPVVRLSKTVTPTTVWAGYPVTYTIVAYNIGEAAAEGVVITDSLPSGFTYASTASMSEITATRTSVYATATPSWGVWDITPTGEVTVTFVVTASTSTGTFSNTVLASSDSISIPTVSDTAPVTVTSLSDLSVTKVMTDTAPDVGSTVRFTVTVTNAGPSDATNVEVTDELPSGYTYVSDDGGGDYDSGTGVWDVGTVNASGSETLLITATVEASGDYSNEAEVTAVSEDDPDSTPNDGSGDDYASVTATPNPVADLRVEKQVSDSTPDVGNQIVFTVTVTNDGPSDTTGVEIGDSLPAGYTLVATDTTQGSYASGTGAWTVGGLANGASASLYITVTVEAAGPYANTASVTASDEDDDDSSNDSDTETATPNPVADLELNLSASDTAPDVNDTVVFTVVLTNTGPSNATGVQVSMTIPSGYAYVGDSGSGAYDSGTGLWDVGALNDGASVTLVITATVDASGAYDLYAQVGASNQYDTDSTPGDGSTTDDDDDAVSVTAPGIADLSLSKTVDSVAPSVTDNVIFTLTLSNDGPDQATGVVVSDSLPSGYTFVSYVASLGIYTATTGEWRVSAIAANTSVTLTITATVNGSGDYGNYAQVWASDQYDNDSTPGDDSTTQDDDDTQVTFPGAASADLSLDKTVDDVVPDVGSDVLFTITVANSGPADATGVVVSDTLSSGYTFVSYRASQGVYTDTTGEWNVSTIAADTSVTLTITATVNASGDYGNYAQVWASNEGDPDSTPGDDSTTDDDDDVQSTTPNPVADLSLDLDVTDPTPDVGSTIVFALTVTNDGPSDATGVVVTDLLPDGYTYVGDSGGGTYASGTGAWTVGNLTSGASETLLITVTVDASGNYSNYAQVSASDQSDPDSTPGDNSATEDDDDTQPTTPNAVADLSLSKVSQPSPAEPGEAITYTIEVVNAGPSALTAITLTDDLPAAILGEIYTPSEGNYDSATGAWIGLTFDAGSRITLTITGTLDSAFAGVLQNTAVVNTGQATDPDPTDNQATDTNSTAPVIQAVKRDTLVIDADADGVPSPGDTLSYTIIITNSGGSSATGVTFSDVPDSNTTLVVGSVTASLGSITSGETAGDTNAGVDVGPIPAGDSVTIIFRVTIDNPLPAGVTRVVNQGVMSSNELPDEPTDDPDTAPGHDETETPVTAAPMLEAEKTGTLLVDADGNGVPSPGDTLLYQVRVVNGGNIAATGVVFNDNIGANTALVVGTVQTSMGVVSGGNNPGDTDVAVDVGPLAGGGNVDISYQVTIDDPLPAGVTEVANQGLVSSNELPVEPTDDPDTVPDDDETEIPVVAGPDVVAYKRDSLVVDADGNGMPSPGDTLFYQVTIVNKGNGAATGVSFGDLLAANLQLLTGTVQTSQGIVLSGNGLADTGVLIAIGTLPGGGASVQIDYRATIVDPLPAGVTRVANQGLVIGDNLPSVQTDDPDTPAGDDPTVTPVAVAPDVDTYKSDLLFVDADGDGVASPGDTLLYQVTIVNFGNGAAEGVVFADLLVDPNLTLVVGTVRTSLGAVTSGNSSGDTGVAVAVGPLSGGGGTVDISFQVVITDPLPGGVTQVANQGFVSGDNIPTEPTDDPGSAEEEDDTETPVVARPSIEAYKRDSLLIDGDGNGEPSPGDTLLYQVTILNDGNQDATGVTYVDLFSDPNLILVTGTVQTDQGLVLTGNDPGDAGVMVDVGTLSGEGGVVHVSFQATIANPLPAGVTQVSNHGLVNSNELPVEPTDDPDSPEEDDDTATDVTAAPDLEGYKTDFLFVDADGNGVPSPGDTLLYRVTMINNGNLAATGVLFEDVPDPNTTLVTGTVQTSLGTVTTGNNAGDTGVAVDVGALPGGGASVDVSFLVMVGDPLPVGTAVVANQGLVSSNELPDEPTDDPATGVEDDETATPVTVEPALEVEKTDALLVDADADGMPSAGDTLFYRVTIFNTGNAAATGVSFGDALDPNTALVTGTVQTSLGTVVSGNSSGDVGVIVDVGALPGGGAVEISYQAVISSLLPAGVTQVANQGVASGDNVADEPTDDPDTPEDDDDTQTSLVICSVPADIYEPDNLHTYAAEIPTDGTVQTHTFHVAADKDWVRFYAQVGKIYTLTTSHLLADVDTVLELYDTDGVTLLDENDDYLPGSNASRIVWIAPAEGWYYARVTHFDHTYDPRGSLVCGNQFLLAVVEAGVCPVDPDTYEPDNLYTDALTIATDGSVQPHTFHVAADKDWASFHAFARRVYTLTTSQLGADVDTVLELYDADGVTLLEENDDYLPGSNASRIVWTASTDGQYYVRITHFDRTYDPRQSLICGNHYLLAVEEAAICSVGPDVYEPDNLYPQVADIPTDGTLQARTFHVAADKDWVGFYALAGHVYTVTTSQLGADVDTVLELYDTDGVTLLDENDDYLPGSDGSRIVWTAPAEGRYYVRVTHFDRTYDPRESLVCGNQYLISVEATSCDVAPDMYESDNYYTQAPVIPTDGTVQTHTFHVAADKDWVKFFAWGGQVYTATTSRLSPDVDTVLQLYDADGVTLLLENDDYLSGSDASHLVWTAPADGWYFVRITHFDTAYDPRRSSFCGNQYRIAMRQQILDVTKTGEAAPSRLRPGDEILYTIVVTNLMNIPQTRIVITDAIPNYTTYVSGSVSISQGSVAGPDPLVADIGTLAPGQRVVLTFRVALREDSRGQTIINQAVVASDHRVLPVSSPLTSVIVYRYIYLPVVIK